MTILLIEYSFKSNNLLFNEYSFLIFVIKEYAVFCMAFSKWKFFLYLASLYLETVFSSLMLANHHYYLLLHRHLHFHCYLRHSLILCLILGLIMLKNLVYSYQYLIPLPCLQYYFLTYL